MLRRRVIPLLAVSGLALGGCAATAADESGAQGPTIVTSTNVYASIVEQIVGDHAEVSAIVESGAQDPHSYEATARDQLAVQDADLVVVNGGGYDAFMDQLIEKSGSDPAVVTAVEHSHDWPGNEGHDDHAHDHDEAEDGAEETEESEETPSGDGAPDDANADAEGDHAEHDHAEGGGDHDHADESGEHAHDDGAGDSHDHAEDAGSAEHDHAEGTEAGEHDHADDTGDHAGHDHVEGFNEHIWYDPHTMAHVVEAISAELTDLLPDAEADISEGAAALTEELTGLEQDLEAIAATAEGSGYVMTEPIGDYLAHAAGLSDVTPEGFAALVEEGQDVAPATLLAATTAIEDGEAAVVIANAETGGAETDRVIEAAEASDVPVVEYTELLPEGEDYVSWMSGNVSALGDALDG